MGGLVVMGWDEVGVMKGVVMVMKAVVMVMMMGWGV